jgi:predicted acylesterase/phospholipase RssA
MACRASMAVPFLFNAVSTNEGDLLVDGGVLDNCPMHAFDTREGVLNPTTLGMWISTTGEPQQAAPSGLRDFSMRMIELILYVEQYRAHRRHQYNDQVLVSNDVSL